MGEFAVSTEHLEAKIVSASGGLRPHTPVIGSRSPWPPLPNPKYATGRHLIVKPSTRTSVRCKDLGDICCTSRGIAHFVLNFVAMATKVGRGKIQLAAFDGPFRKTPPQMQKISRYFANWLVEF